MKTYKLTREFPTMTFSSLGGNQLDFFCRKIFFQKLNNLKQGKLEIVENFSNTNKSFMFGEDSETDEISTKIIILNPRAYSRIALGGSIGAGESYRDKDWDTTDLKSLTRLIQLFVRNRETLQSMESGIGSIAAPIQKFLHRLRDNSVTGSKKNIHAHYDIGNNFFELFLDHTWMYSSAIFKNDSSTLEEGSIEKIDRICRKLKLGPNDHVMEIGTGWGGFAVHAAKNYGCHVTTTTISEEQYAFAQNRIKAAGLENKITLLFQDYRLLTGKFDKLVSIEMIEAVGLNHLDTYFEKCSSLLKPNGVMLLQAITIQDQFYEQAKKSVDFIQTHIFPGSGIPSVGSIASSISRKTDLRIGHLEDFGTHYARTLRFWSENLQRNYTQMIERGYPEELYRLWQFYLSYCEGGFIERSIGCAQIQLLKGEAKEISIFDIQ
jgi:cyclopropane-fatty-acyl-phospholipid synthase